MSARWRRWSAPVPPGSRIATRHHMLPVTPMHRVIAPAVLRAVELPG